MKKFLTFLTILLTVHTISPIKIESFDEGNSQDNLMEAICHPHISTDDRMGWAANALIRGADLRIHDYEPVREAIRRGHLGLLIVFLEAGLSPDLRVYDKTIIDYITELPNYSASLVSHIKNIIAIGNSHASFKNVDRLINYNYGGYRQERVLLCMLTAIAHDKPVAKAWLRTLIATDAWLSIEYLLDNGFITTSQEINFFESLLHAALTYNSYNVAQLLLSRGAQLDIRKSRQAQRQMAINIVAAKLHIDPVQIMQLLLEYRYMHPNSDVPDSLVTFQQPIIMLCAQNNAARCIRLLAYCGADLAPETHPESSLQAAVQTNCLEATQALMESGAYGLIPQAKLPTNLARAVIHTQLNIRDRSARVTSYLANFRRTSLLLRALYRNLLAHYLPIITDSLYSSDRRYYDKQYNLARLILEYSQGIKKIPAPAKVTTLVHAPKKSAKRHYADMQAADQPAVGAARAAGAHLSASAQAEIAARSTR